MWALINLKATGSAWMQHYILLLVFVLTREQVSNA